MKKLMLLVLILGVAACGQQTTQESDDVAKMELVGNYGEKITDEGAVTAEEMIARLADQDSVALKVRGEIVATCAMKGCWMNLVLADGEEMRVTFKDYGFFVPKEGMEGNMAVIEGVATRTLTDVETLKHYAGDAGKPQEEIDAITEAREELTFVATGVNIYKVEETEESAL